MLIKRRRFDRRIAGSQDRRIGGCVAEDGCDVGWFCFDNVFIKLRNNKRAWKFGQVTHIDKALEVVRVAASGGSVISVWHVAARPLTRLDKKDAVPSQYLEESRPLRPLRPLRLLPIRLANAFQMFRQFTAAHVRPLFRIIKLTRSKDIGSPTPHYPSPAKPTPSSLPRNNWNYYEIYKSSYYFYSNNILCLNLSCSFWFALTSCSSNIAVNFRRCSTRIDPGNNPVVYWSQGLNYHRNI